MLHLNKKAEIQLLSGIREDEEQSLESIYSDVGGVEVKVPRLLSYILERLVLRSGCSEFACQGEYGSRRVSA